MMSRERDLQIDETRTIPGHALSWTAARASGPGGQHVNRTESKVQLTLDPNQVYWLLGPVRERLIRLAGHQADGAGHITIASQEHREQSRNLEEARGRMAELVRTALIRPKRRIATKPTKGSIRRRLDEKRRTSIKKNERQRREDE
jgi:ribosome-associated protein